MDASDGRRRRLQQLLDLAQNYRGWTRKDLASALGRDPTKLVPGSGVPKLDLVVDLASSLDWTVEDVVDFLWFGEDRAARADDASSFEALDEACRAAHRAGDAATMVALARKAFAAASTAEERARACNREAGGWDLVGRFQESMRAIQLGLRQTPVPGELRRMLQSNLANAYYAVWQLVEAQAVAGDLLAWYDEHPAETERDRRSCAFARYVAGHTARRLITLEPDRAAHFARQAEAHLQASAAAYDAISAARGDTSYAGIAHTCRGGLLEAGVVLGRLSAREALDQIETALDGVADGYDGLAGDWVESHGWWCIFGCNVALRHLDDEREVQRRMAVFTTKAEEIADHLDSWSIRERVFTMDHTRWERAVGATGFDIPCVVDLDDVRVITGTMARFPSFRDTGWSILRNARVVSDA